MLTYQSKRDTGHMMELGEVKHSKNKETQEGGSYHEINDYSCLLYIIVGDTGVRPDI